MPTCEKVRRSVLKNTRSPGLSSSRVHLLRPAARGLLVGAARQHQAQAHLEHVAREAAAVEALVGAVAAAAVGHAEEVHRRHHQVGGAVAHLAAPARWLPPGGSPRLASNWARPRSCGSRAALGVGAARRAVQRRRGQAARRPAGSRQQGGQQRRRAPANGAAAGAGYRRRAVRHWRSPPADSRSGLGPRPGQSARDASLNASAVPHDRVPPNREETPMFKALLLEKSRAGFSAALRELDEARLPAGDVLRAPRVLDAQLQGRPGDHEPRRRWCAAGRWCAGIDGAGTVLESSHPAWQPGDRFVHNGWGVGETHWGCLAERARLKGDWLVALPAAFTHAPGDGHRHRRLHRDAVRAGARAPRPEARRRRGAGDRGHRRRRQRGGGAAGAAGPPRRRRHRQGRPRPTTCSSSAPPR